MIFQNTPYNFNDSRRNSSKCRSRNFQPGNSQKTKDKNGIKNNIYNHP